MLVLWSLLGLDLWFVNANFLNVPCMHGKNICFNINRFSMNTLSLTQEAKICNGEKIISLTSGAGKTG